MSREVLVSIRSITKKFSKDLKLGAKKGLRKTLLSFLGLNDSYNKNLGSKEFCALQRVSFDVCRGEAVGLLGKNGAGKSTLLKHISGIYLPDLGEIEVVGHVEGLIELGAGFHPLLSGRDNIKQRCSMLGFDGEKLTNLMDEIIEFSELDDFIDMPVQNYSSGMKARLGFASAVLVKPDVLLVDEALSVGDFSFQQKCLAKINEIKAECAVIFVSHGIQAMKMFCSRGIVFDKGQITFDGDMDAAADFYLNQKSEKKHEKKILEDFKKEFVETFNSHDVLGQQVRPNNSLKSLKYWWSNDNGEKKQVFSKDDSVIQLNIEVDIEDITDLEKDVFIGVPIWKEDKMIYLTALNSDRKKFFIKTSGKILVKLKVDNIFNHGRYLACIAIHEGPQYLARKIIEPFEIANIDVRDHGAIRLNEKWEVE